MRSFRRDRVDRAGLPSSRLGQTVQIVESPCWGVWRDAWEQGGTVEDGADI